MSLKLQRVEFVCDHCPSTRSFPPNIFVSRARQIMHQEGWHSRWGFPNKADKVDYCPRCWPAVKEQIRVAATVKEKARRSAIIRESRHRKPPQENSTSA